MTELPTGWATAVLGEIARAQYGKGLRQKDRHENGPYPVYGSAGRAGSHDQALVDGPVLIVGRKGNAGAVWLENEPCWPIDTTYYLRVPEGFDPRFLAYKLSAMGLRSLDSSTAVPSLRRQDLEASRIVVAPRGEQERIVAAIEEHFSRLDAAEATIAAVTKRLQALHDLMYAQALSADHAEVVRLGEVAKTVSGGTPRRSRAEYFGGGIPWIKSGELRDGVVTSTDETITSRGLEKSSAKFLPRDTLLIAMYGATIGALGRIGTDEAATN